MKTIEIQANRRNDAELGKTGSKAIRKSDTVPCVVYFNSVATPVKISTKDIKRILNTPETYLINLNIDGQIAQVVTKHADFHPVTDKVLHVEFIQVSNDRKVEVSLPVKLTGNAVGVTKGGKLMLKLRKIKVKGFVDKLPSEVEVNISSLDLGGTILIKDVVFDEIEVTSPPTSAVASVEIPRSLRSAMKGK
ncbi:MAG: 50S ribosomal protein L25 [Bacteroidia bacterium]|nr:50S ribosomal protein L25 [Bacteroidia bacterium]